MSFEAELVRRYGNNVLTLRQREKVPPRLATPTKNGVRRMLAVVPRAGARRKLVDEIRQEGHKAHVCRHRETKEVPVNLVFTNALPAFAKHAANVLGEIATREILNLYGKRPPPPPPEPDPFKPEDVVMIEQGPFADHQGVVQRKDRKGWLVEVSLFGRACTVTMATHSMRKIHIEPG